MDTRQLAAFCAVVERRSFSQAAERLGVTQPAVSLQVRALEKRLGTQLLDRSGRRVEPTEAGLRLYRGAQRLLTLEGQILDEVAGEGEGRADRRAADRRLDRPRRRSSCRSFSASSSASTRASRIALTVADTQAVVERVAARELELGIVGAARRHRAVELRAVLRRRGHPRRPARPRVRRPHRLARRAARREPDRDAGGRRRPPDRRGRAARARHPPARPRRPARARAAGVGAERRAGGLRRHVHLPFRGRAGARRRHARLGQGRRAGREARDRARARDRAHRRREPPTPSSSSRTRGSPSDRPLGPRGAAGARRRAAASSSRARAGAACSTRHDRWEEVPSHRIDVPDGVDTIVAIGGGSAIDTAKAASAATGLPLVSVPTTYSGAEWTTFFGVRDPDRRHARRRSGREPARDRLRAGADARACRCRRPSAPR